MCRVTERGVRELFLGCPPRHFIKWCEIISYPKEYGIDGKDDHSDVESQTIQIIVHFKTFYISYNRYKISSRFL